MSDELITISDDACEAVGIGVLDLFANGAEAVLVIRVPSEPPYEYICAKIDIPTDDDLCS